MLKNKFEPVESDGDKKQLPWLGLVLAALLIGFFVLDSIEHLQNLVEFLVGSAIVVGVYLIPAAVAWNRKHNNRNAIITLNVLLGWTVIGWAGALVWAMTKDVDKVDGVD